MEKLEKRDDEFILSIDPAYSTTGFSVINKNTMELEYIDKFTTSPKKTDEKRMKEIVTKLFCIANQYNVRYIVLEDGFLGRNPNTALQLATLRGAIIGVFLLNCYTVYHMQPSQIRKLLGCGGNAKKEQVAKEIIKLYPNNNKLINIGPYSDKQNKNKTSDIYDSIAIGVAFIKSLKDAEV